VYIYEVYYELRNAGQRLNDTRCSLKRMIAYMCIYTLGIIRNLKQWLTFERYIL